MLASLSKNINKGFLFHFPKIKYPSGSGIDKSNNLNYSDKNMIYACFAISLLWIGIILAYSVGLLSNYPNKEIPVFLMVSILFIAVFPVFLIVSGYFIYKNILKAQETGVAILEAARTLSSPALNAAEDVKKLSSAIADEMGAMRYNLREIEDQVEKVKEKLNAEIKALQDAGKYLEKSADNISGKIANERNNVIDYMKHIKSESIAAKNIAEKTQIRNKNHPIELTDIENNIPTQDNIKIKGEVAQKIQNIMDTENKADDNGLLDASEEEKPASFSLSDIKPLEEEPESYILRNQRGLYEGLYALTVDLNRTLGTSAPQDLWPRYMRGERNVFASYLFEWVQDNYESYKSSKNSDDFIKISNRFITQFETLRERLFDTPHTEISEFLENSGIGGIYKLLSSEIVTK